MNEIKTVQDLLDALEGVDPSTPLRVASQPNWPLRNVVKNVVRESQLDRPQDDADDEGFSEGGDVVWLAVDTVDSFDDESPYAPKEAWGW